jgi:glucose-6-phosphate 1-dehydrogenase
VNENPLREGLETERTPAPCIFVIFGASGDLTRRKLLPALYDLAISRLLPPGISIVGFAVTEIGEEEFRRSMHDAVAQFSRRKPIDEAVWADFASRLHYVSGKFEDEFAFARLREKLGQIDRTNSTRNNRLYYLAVPPSVFGLVVDGLARGGLVAPPDALDRYTRIIVEKPFGRDLASGQALNLKLHRVFDESQIFRIDHYLGKETVQNIMALRFGNAIFEPLWNQKYVDHIQITVAEDIGVEGRGRFYEEAGAMRDIVQNHLLELLMVMAMEPPIAFVPDDVRDEKVKVLRALKPLRGKEALALTVRGQYGPGNFAGKPVPGYRQEPNVSPTSNVETFVALKMEIDNWRFAGVPIYARAGKRLGRRVTEISVHFKRVPHALLTPSAPGAQVGDAFGRAQVGDAFGRAQVSDAFSIDPDILALRIQPDDGISLRFAAKVPGPSMTLRPVTMDFRYGSTFGGSGPDAYERLILDAMLGDATLFARADEVIAAWKFVTPILEAWASAPAPAFPNYAAGTWGPDAAFELIEKDGRQWRRL